MDLQLTVEHMGLNCVSPLICGYFSVVNTTVLQGPGWLNPMIRGYEGPTISNMQINLCIFQGSIVLNLLIINNILESNLMT